MVLFVIAPYKYHSHWEVAKIEDDPRLTKINRGLEYSRKVLELVLGLVLGLGLEYSTVLYSD
jgi:hypothetical protein